MKRSLGPLYWRPSPAEQPAKHWPCTTGRGPGRGKQNGTSQGEGPVKGESDHPPTLKLYARGSLKTALDLISSSMSRTSSKENVGRHHIGSTRISREGMAWVSESSRLWRPLQIDPWPHSTVMGALDRAEFRSAELYLWTAKSIHIERGHEWTAQLIQAARRAKAACKRGRGPAKQAQPLPLSDLHRISDQLSPEASFAKVQHIQFEHRLKIVHWLLPSSKTDWQALGCARTHACACSDGIDPANLPPIDGRICEVLQPRLAFPLPREARLLRRGGLWRLNPLLSAWTLNWSPIRACESSQVIPHVPLEQCAWPWIR